jgi:hypothetical protein
MCVSANGSSKLRARNPGRELSGTRAQRSPARWRRAYRARA